MSLFVQLFTPETRKVFNPFNNPAVIRDLEISRSNLRSLANAPDASGVEQLW